MTDANIELKSWKLILKVIAKMTQVKPRPCSVNDISLKNSHISWREMQIAYSRMEHTLQ